MQRRVSLLSLHLRGALAGVLVVVGSVALGACADDADTDVPSIEDPEDVSEDGELDGERPGLGGDPGDGPEVDDDGDFVEEE